LIYSSLKPVVFVGDSLRRLRQFPEDARRAAGFQLDRVQRGFDPLDWKPMPGVGPGIREIRVRDEKGAFRVIYIARLPEAVYVLHAFRKTSQRTPGHELDMVRHRFNELTRSRP
jgi:phage-related protein